MMRKEFMRLESRYQAKKAMHWAAVIVKVCGGYIGFESSSDYTTWSKQV